MSKMGRPIGATSRPQFHTYTTEVDRKEYVAWVRKSFKKSNELAKWYGDQLFGKAAQPLTGEGGGPLQVEISEAIAKKHAANARTNKNS